MATTSAGFEPRIEYVGRVEKSKINRDIYDRRLT